MEKKPSSHQQQSLRSEGDGYLCIPEADLPPMEEDFLENFSARMSRIVKEFVTGFQFVRHLERAVVIFGSTRAKRESSHYREAHTLAYLLAKEGYTVVTGGGPGIMEAANRGAYEADGKSLGINIQLKGGQRTNEYVKESIGLRYFFVRKVIFSFAARVYVFFPGGYGTLDEFFEIVTLVQTKKLARKVLIVAVGKEYWNHLFGWIKEDPYKKYQALKKEDLEIVQIVGSAKEAFEKIRTWNGNSK